MKRKRGRPALNVDDARRSVHVNVRLSPRAYDDACLHAKSARVTVPELLRRGLKRISES